MLGSALEQFKADKLLARELITQVNKNAGRFCMLGTGAANIMVRSLTMFAEQDEQKQNCLVVGK